MLGPHCEGFRVRLSLSPVLSTTRARTVWPTVKRVLRSSSGPSTRFVT